MPRSAHPQIMKIVSLLYSFRHAGPDPASRKDWIPAFAGMTTTRGPRLGSAFYVNPKLECPNEFKHLWDVFFGAFHIVSSFDIRVSHFLKLGLFIARLTSPLLCREGLSPFATRQLTGSEILAQGPDCENRLSFRLSSTPRVCGP
jgi:hypothetical protein